MFSAFFTVLILRRRLSLVQWFSLLILCVGVATVQWVRTGMDLMRAYQLLGFVTH